MPSPTDVRVQINAAIKTVTAELGRATTQDAKAKLKQSLRELIQLRADVARSVITSNSQALLELKRKLDAAVQRAREAQLSHAAGQLGQIVDAVTDIVGGATGQPGTTAPDDRPAPPPPIEGLPPPDADTPDAGDSTVSAEEYWYADEREDLVAVKTDTLTEPPPPADPTDAPQWPADAWSPDYGHLGRPASAETFRFAAADLALLCRLNAFDVAFGQDEVLFGLRGCMIAGGTGGKPVEEVMLREAEPNHRDFRCVIGVWKRSTNRIAVFTGSTVPNPTGMKRQFAFGDAERRCNLLPTGRYKYIVGNHKAVPGAFRLEQEVVVLRTHDDLMFETTDFWDRCTPGDNIHPAWASSEARFSSFGCQTVSGAHQAATGHTGEWAAFRAAAGLGGGSDRDGRTYVYILLTGREAHYARYLNDAGKADDPAETAAIRRLRFGSGTDGDESLRAPVRALQQGLALGGPDGAYGPTTAMAVIEWQKKTRGFADGVVTPVQAATLGVPLGPAAAAEGVADPSTLGPLTRTSADPLPPAPGVVSSGGDHTLPTALQISEKAVFSFMLGNESFYAYQYFMPEGDTIGYGHLINTSDGNRFQDGLTEDEAFALFQEDMGFFVGVIRRSIKVPITQGQFDALASLTANVGHVPSAVEALINAGDFAAAGDQFRRYSRDIKGTVLPGLVRRREMESHLFLTGSYPRASLSGAQVLTRDTLRDRHLRQIEGLFPDRLGDPHGSPTRELQRRQARGAYQRMTGRVL